MLTYRQILPLLLLFVAFTGCNGIHKPRWMSRQQSQSEDRRTVNSDAEESSADGEDQRSADPAAGSGSEDGELVAVERQSRMIRDAQSALRQERLEDARQLYRQVLNEVPEHPDAHHGLAMASDLDEDWGDAEYHYKQALRIRPRDAVLLSDIGYSYVLQNRFSEAARYLNQAIEIQPGYERAHMNLALLDLKQGNRPAAEQRLVQRLGNTSQTAGILASLERQAFPDSAIAAAPRTDSQQNSPAAGFEQVQEMARRERILAEQQRMERENANDQIAPWTSRQPPSMPTPAVTVSGNQNQAAPLPAPAVASRSTVPGTNSSSAQYPDADPRTADASLAGQRPLNPADRPSGRLSIPNPPSPSQFPSARSDMAAAHMGSASQMPPDSAGNASQWSANSPESSASAIAMTPPVPIRSSGIGTTVGAESYGQPAGFNRSLPSRMRVSESGGGQGGFAVSQAAPGFRAEGLSIGPGSLFPAVETQAPAAAYPAAVSSAGSSAYPNSASSAAASAYPETTGYPAAGLNPSQGQPAMPQRPILPASYSDAMNGNGMIPAWGNTQQFQPAVPSGEPVRNPSGAGAVGSPGAWPPAAGIQDVGGAQRAQWQAPVAPAPLTADRTLQSYRDQLQRMDAEYNRQPAPPSYNTARP